MAGRKTLQQIDVFISSPRDVQAEREIAKRVIERLNRLRIFARHFVIKGHLHERETPPVAGTNPQSTVDRYMIEPDQADILVCILWSRIGMPFTHEKTGEEFISGTFYEFVSAYRANRDRGTPHILLYRGRKPLPSDSDPEQVKKLRTFFGQFEGPDALYQAYIREYENDSQFEEMLFQHLETLITENFMARDGQIKTSTDTESSLHRSTVLPLRAWPNQYHLMDEFVGRKAELKELDTWATSRNNVMIINAMGGMGKSALTWKWITDPDHGPRSFSPKGIFWFNFYEKGASLEGFSRHALAYVTGQAYTDVQSQPYREVQRQLMSKLHEGPYLLVLDGLERVLVAYNQDTDNAHLRDELFDNNPAKTECADPEDGDFLRQLANCTPSKILISTRLIPRVFEPEGVRLASVQVRDLKGFEPEDAQIFLYQAGIKVADHDLLDRFIAQFGYHPLMLRVIAGSVKSQARGNFNTWYEREGRDMQLSELDEEGKVTAILNQALGDLPDERKLVLAIIGVFSEAVHAEVLDSLNPYLPPRPALKDLPPIPQLFINPRGSRPLAQLRRQSTADMTPEEREHHAAIIREMEESENRQRADLVSNYPRLKRERDRVIQQRRKRFHDYRRDPLYKAAQRKFNSDLRDLQQRGVLQYSEAEDGKSGVYDLHPLVRAYVTDDRSGIGEAVVQEARQRVIGELESRPLDASKPFHELREEYTLYIADQRWERAATFFNMRMQNHLFKQGKHQEIIRLLTPFFGEQFTDDPPLPNLKTRAAIIHNFAVALEFMGRFEKAANLHSRNIEIALQTRNTIDLIQSLIRYARVMRETNAFSDARRVLAMARDAAERLDHPYMRYEAYGETFRLACITAEWEDAEVALQQIHKLETEHEAPLRKQGIWEKARILLGQIQMNTWRNEDSGALFHELEILPTSSYFISAMAAKYRAIQAFEHDDMAAALDLTNTAITKARNASIPEAGLMALRARILQRTGRHQDAANSAQSALSSIESSGVIDKSDAYYNLAEYLLASGASTAQAIDYARRAYELAWCDGPPNSYAWGLNRANLLLDRLSETKPQLSNRQSYSIPYESEVRDYIDSVQPKIDPPEPPRHDFHVKEFRWFQLGVIAFFDVVTEEDRSKMTNLGLELYALCDEPGPGLASTGDQIVNPDPPEISYLENCVEQKIPEELDLKFLRQAEQRHDGIAIAYIIAATPENELVYLYMSVRSENIVSLYEKGFSGEELNLVDYGRVIHHSAHPPTNEERDMMFDNWLFCEYFLPIKLIARRAGGD